MNSTNNNSFEIAAKKVFSDLYVLIKEDENITNKIDDKPKQINVLDSRFYNRDGKYYPSVTSILNKILLCGKDTELISKVGLIVARVAINSSNILFSILPNPIS